MILTRDYEKVKYKIISKDLENSQIEMELELNDISQISLYKPDII
jgi:hypothetical protein